jgi:hypothetical protein
VDNDDELVLLDVMRAHESSLVGRVAEWLLRVEDLSHVLVWTRTHVKSVREACEIARIELPRLQLSFVARKDTDGRTRLYSEDQFGLFVSSNRDPMVQRLVDGIPHAIVLESLDGDVALMVPATLPKRLVDGTEMYSTETAFLRRDRRWLEAIKVRHYLYPVHLSLTFLFTPTLASALYLLLLRLLNRSYSEAFRLIDSCVSDTQLSQEEEQILTEIGFLKDDMYPDAHACKLKLTLATADSNMPRLPWYVT